MSEVCEERLHNAASAFMCSHVAVCINTVCMIVSIRVELQKRNLNLSEINRLDFGYLH